MRKFCTFSFVCLTILSLSCKKSGSDASSSYIKTLINDSAMTFNVNAKAYSFKNGGTTSLAITGNANNRTVENIALLITTTTTNPIAAGTYSESDSSVFVTSAIYTPNMMNVEYRSGGSVGPNRLKIIITSIDDKTVKGSFSGDLFGSLVVKSFTQGEFSVNF